MLPEYKVDEVVTTEFAEANAKAKGDCVVKFDKWKVRNSPDSTYNT